RAQVQVAERVPVRESAQGPVPGLVSAAAREPVQVSAWASVPAQAVESDAGNADACATNVAWWCLRRGSDRSGSSYRPASTSRRSAGPLLRTQSAIRCNRTEERCPGLSERAACEVSLMSLR